MSKVHLITGYKGEEHIKAADQGSFNASFFGGGEYVMEAGNQFEASIMDNNTVRILDGDLLMQGRHIRIEPETYEDITITTGTAGMNRIDLIVMQYSKDTSTDIETAQLVVVKGTETEGNAAEPVYTSGNILSGATLNQMPLYRVKVEGVVLTDIEPLFNVIPTYKTLAEKYAKQFQEACDTYIGLLNILDTMEEVEANTQEGQLAGALSLKELKNTLQSAIDTKVTNSFTPDRVLYSNSSGKVATAGEITSTELGYLNGATSNIQNQLNGKLKNSGFTAERVLISGSNGAVTESGTTSTELYMLHGVTSNVQTQLNNRPTIGSEPDFHGVHLSSSKTAYVYSSDDNVNFVYKTSTGGTGYSSVRALAEDKLPKAGGTVTGKLTTQQVENSTGYAVGANSNSYSTAPFVASAPYSTNTGSRAGYGFHNHGNNGTFLYLQTDGTMHHINNSGQDRKIMDSSNFSYDASTQTLNITL